jgi:hypothetical protein
VDGWPGTLGIEAASARPMTYAAPATIIAVRNVHDRRVDDDDEPAEAER